MAQTSSEHFSSPAPLGLREVLQLWWPLAVSWVMMAFELPLVASIVARLPNPEIHLAAYGSVVFPLCLLIEAPVIMMLSASTALSGDQRSYRALGRFMHRLGAALTLVHGLVAFTPLGTWILVDLMGEPAALIGPARLGLMLMLPWTWSIAYRRFEQGMLIRLGRSRVVGVGTMLRLGLVGLVATGLARWGGGLEGTAVAAGAVATGVMAEALYAGWAAWRARSQLPQRRGGTSPPATGPTFLKFYFNLALTPLLGIAAHPLGSAAMARLPEALPSLATWPVVASALFVLQALGMAFSEVVIALWSRPRAPAVLGRVTAVLAAGVTLVLLVVLATPLAGWLFGSVFGLAGELVERARTALWLGLPIPALRAAQSRYQGVLVVAGRTAPISAAMGIFLLSSIMVLAGGLMTGRWSGLTVVVTAFALGRTTQTLVLAWTARDELRRSPRNASIQSA